MTIDPPRPVLPTWLADARARSEMAAAVADFDWSTTPLGDVTTWSAGLRLAAGVCLSSRFPMLVVWGPELTKIYNDGYRPVLGDKHPQSLGAPAAQVWPEIWDVIGPMFDTVMTTGVPTLDEDQRLNVERHGYLEECYFTYSYSPLFDDDDSIGGVLDVVTETTHLVVAQRRLSTLSALGGALSRGEQIVDVCLLAAGTLNDEDADIRAVEIHLDLRERVALVASNRRDDASSVEHDTLMRVARDGISFVVGDHADGTMPVEQVVVPIGDDLTGVRGVMVAVLHPMRPFDEAYKKYVQLVADAIGGALDNAFRRTTEVGEYRQISDTLQAAMLRPASDLPTVAARYLPASGNLAVGGDWYDVIDVGGHRRALVVGDCVGHGLQAATVMAQLRSAARAMLLEGRHPAGTLDGLDLFASSLDGAFCATVVVATFDRDDGTVTYSRAGHPPPLVVNGSGSTWLDQATGPPLAVGTAGSSRRNATHVLGGDDMIVLYSDGLIERRGESLDVGLERLAAAGSAMFGSGVQQFADGLIRMLLPDVARDDVVVVVKQLPAPTGDARRPD